MDSARKEEITSILDDASDMTIATVREDGYPQATTVSYVNDGLNIYFGCAADSPEGEEPRPRQQDLANSQPTLHELARHSWSVDRRSGGVCYRPARGR